MNKDIAGQRVKIYDLPVGLTFKFKNKPQEFVFLGFVKYDFLDVNIGYQFKDLSTNVIYMGFTNYYVEVLIPAA